MAWLVPYVINGAAHSAALFRRQAQRPATDQVGVSRPGDLKVTQLPAAATGFRIAQGGLSLPSRFPGRGRESYGVENGDAVIDVVDVPGTGSSARRDAIVVELLDPNYLPITHEDAALTNYMTVHVVQDVAAGAKTIDNITSFNNRTAYVLAFINWPENTTAITNAMIQDARRVAAPQERTEVRAYQATGVTVPELIESSTAETWPHFAEEAGVLSVDIPEWARVMKIVMTVSGYKFSDGSPGRGRFWCQVGRTDNPDRVETQHTEWSGGRPGPVRVSDTKGVPASLRGSVQRFYPRARRDSGTPAQGLSADWATNVDFTVTFQEVAD